MFTEYIIKRTECYEATAPNLYNILTVLGKTGPQRLQNIFFGFETKAKKNKNEMELNTFQQQNT